MFNRLMAPSAGVPAADNAAVAAGGGAAVVEVLAAEAVGVGSEVLVVWDNAGWGVEVDGVVEAVAGMAASVVASVAVWLVARGVVLESWTDWEWLVMMGLVVV